GRKGTSSLLVAPAGVVQATRLLRGLGVAHRFEPIPSAEELRRAADERIFTQLTADDASADPAADARALGLARRLIANGEAEHTLAKLLARFAYAGMTAPREVRVPNVPHERQRGAGPRAAHARERPREARSRDQGRTWVAFRVSAGARQGVDTRRLL